MTDKNKPNLKVLQFPSGSNKEDEPTIPDSLREKIDELHKRTKEGKLRRVAVTYVYESDEDEDMLDGEMFFWHNEHNIYEIVGAVETLKTLAVGMALGGIPMEED